MDIDDVAEKFLPEEVGGHHIIEESALRDLLQLWHETEGKGDLSDPAKFILPLGLADMDPLPRDGARGRQDSLVLSPLVDEVKGMIAPLAVLLAGITGNTVLQYRGIFTPEYFDHLFPGRVGFIFQVLALNQTGPVRAGQTPLFIELELIHQDLLSKALFFLLLERKINPGV
jgi:hypothetical protein